MIISHLCAKHPIDDMRVYDKISICLKTIGYKVINIHPNTIDYISKDGISIVGYKQNNGFWGRVNSFVSMYRSLKRVKPDLIIAPEPDSLMVAYIYKLFHKKSKLIFDCHEAYDLYFNRKIGLQFLELLFNKIIDFEMKYIVKRIDSVISVNNTMTEKFYNYNSNSYFIPNIANIGDLKQNEIEKKNYVYFGQIGWDKAGIEKQESIFFDAARYLRNSACDAKIIIIGGYEEHEIDHINSIKKRIRLLQIEDYIVFVDRLPREQAFILLASSLAGIMRFDSWNMSNNHSLPNKFFEYMSAKMAIICCKKNIEQTKIVIEEQCGIAVNDETGIDLAKAIIYLHNNKEVCLKYGENAYAATKLKYNWDYYGLLLKDVVEKTILS